MTLPPKDSPVWARLEEDAAAERGTPLFNYLLMRGPANAPKRRTYFKLEVARYRRPLLLKLLLLCSFLWVLQVGWFLHLRHRPLVDLLWGFVGTAIGIVTVGLAFELPRRRRFARAVTRYAEQLAEDDVRAAH